MRTSSCWFPARISVRVESGDWFLEWRQAPNSEQQPVSRFRDDFSPAKLGRTESCKVCPAIFDADPRTFEFECESLRGLTATIRWTAGCSSAPSEGRPRLGHAAV